MALSGRRLFQHGYTAVTECSTLDESMPSDVQADMEGA